MSCQLNRPTVDDEGDHVLRLTLLCIVLASVYLWLMWNGRWAVRVAS